MAGRTDRTGAHGAGAGILSAAAAIAASAGTDCQPSRWQQQRKRWHSPRYYKCAKCSVSGAWRGGDSGDGSGGSEPARGSRGRRWCFLCGGGCDISRHSGGGSSCDSSSTSQGRQRRIRGYTSGLHATWERSSGNDGRLRSQEKPTAATAPPGGIECELCSAKVGSREVEESTYRYFFHGVPISTQWVTI